jgi:hypothetical protein
MFHRKATACAFAVLFAFIPSVAREEKTWRPDAPATVANLGDRRARSLQLVLCPLADI